MKRVVILLFALIILANSAAYSQSCLPGDVAYKVKNEGFSKSQIESLAQFMTDDMGPRLAASQLKVRAEEMMVDKLIQLGFSNVKIEFAYDFPKGGWDNWFFSAASNHISAPSSSQ